MNEPANDGSGIVGKAAHAAGTASAFALGAGVTAGTVFGAKKVFSNQEKTSLDVRGVVNENIKKPTALKKYAKDAPKVKYNVKDNSILSTISESGDNAKKISLDLKSKKNAKKIRGNIKPSRSSAGTFKKIKNFLKK